MPSASTVATTATQPTTTIMEQIQEGSAVPDMSPVSAMDTVTALVTVETVKQPELGPDSYLVARVRLREVLFVDRDFLKRANRSDRMQTGDELVVEIAPEARATVERLRQADDQTVLLLVTPAVPDEEIKARPSSWGVTAAVNRKSGQFVSDRGANLTASLRSLDPTMVSFDRELAWVAEPEGGATTQRLTDIVRMRLGEGRKPPTWAETDPLLRSLAIGDIPAEERSKFIAIGLAIEWADPPKGLTAVLRSPSGVSHATGSEAGNHVALGYARSGDRLKLDLCRSGLSGCKTLGDVSVTSEAPVVIVKLSGERNAGFATYAKSAVVEARDSIAAVKLRDEIDLYVKQGILETLGAPAPTS